MLVIMTYVLESPSITIQLILLYYPDILSELKIIVLLTHAINKDNKAKGLTFIDNSADMFTKRVEICANMSYILHFGFPYYGPTIIRFFH